MLSIFGRATVSKYTAPLGRALVGIGLTPDAMTLVGTVASITAAITLFPSGHLFWGALVLGLFVMFDLVDGAMARARGGGTKYGAVLDATCDRLADGAIFAGLAWWAVYHENSRNLLAATLICLVTSQVISYAKARAEASGLTADGGLIERPDRLVIVLVGAGLTGIAGYWGVGWLEWAIYVAMWVLAVASAITVLQRVLAVRRSPGSRDVITPPLPEGAEDAATRTAAPTTARPTKRHRRHRTRQQPDRKREAGVVTVAERLSDSVTPAGGGWFGHCRNRSRGRCSTAARTCSPAAAGPSSCAATWPASSASTRPPCPTTSSPHRSAPTRVTGARRSGCRRWTSRPPRRCARGSRGRENLFAALEEGRGAVLALPHSGNWDMAGVWLAQTTGRFATVAERLKPESLYRRFLAYRESLGFEIFPVSHSDPSPMPQLAQRLRDNGAVALLGERDLARSGVSVEFFGETTLMPPGSAKLAIETGAALLPRTAGSPNRAGGARCIRRSM